MSAHDEEVLGKAYDSRLMRRLVAYLGPYRPQVAIALVAITFGSLVSLGELSAVGTLMGRLIGGSLLIQGLIARLMYTSLYKMHQVSIHGAVRVLFDTLGRFLRERLEPRVKLH